MWRKHRDAALSNLEILSKGADDVSTLFRSRQAASAGHADRKGNAAGPPPASIGKGSKAVTVKITGLPKGTTANELAELMVQNNVTATHKVHVVEKIQTGFVVLQGAGVEGQLAAALRMDGKSVQFRRKADGGSAGNVQAATLLVAEHTGKTKKKKKNMRTEQRKKEGGGGGAVTADDGGVGTQAAKRRRVGPGATGARVEHARPPVA